MTRGLRRMGMVLGLALAMAISTPGLGADGGFVLLLPDQSDRYLPAVDNAGTITVLADIDSITPPDLSPDGRRVAFSGAIGDESLGRYALFLVDSDGSGLTQVTNGELSEFDPSWSPDSQKIVFSQNTGGSLQAANCCRLAVLDVATSSITPLTTNSGAVRPSFSPDGAIVVYDTPSGVYKVSSSGGPAIRIAVVGRDATVSPDGSRVAYVVDGNGVTQIRVIPINSGPAVTIYSTSGDIEAPHWLGSRIEFFEYQGSGYDGREAVALRSVSENGGTASTVRSFGVHAVGMGAGRDNEEIFFYRSDGTFAYHDVDGEGSLGAPLQGGAGYSSGWSAIPAINIDGDGSDEILFYRATDGTFKYYELKASGALGSSIRSGTGYSTGWSSIEAADLDGDGQHEAFFYRQDDGAFRYYDITSSASLGAPIASGTYTAGWTSITAVDIDGDGSDEMLFYRADEGVFKYYDLKPGGGLGSLIRSGTGYSTSWTSISAIDLDGDGQDEILFYAGSNGTYAYYDITASASLGSLIATGSDYDAGWTSVTNVQLGR